MQRAEFFCGDRPGVGAAEGPGKAELAHFGKRDFVWVTMPAANQIWLSHKHFM